MTEQIPPEATNSLGTVIASFAGSVVGVQWFPAEMPFWRKMASIASGFMAALFLTPLAVLLFPVTAGGRDAVAFVIGMASMHLAPAIIDKAEQMIAGFNLPKFGGKPDDQQSKD